jgi:O-acetyl-ADP-ribose deacetylase (regulator of RNase III)
MPLKIVRHDITKMAVDAIVNASNIALKMGGGVSGAIFAAAGAAELQAACDRIGSCKVGESVITGGYNLPAKHIIHTVGPIWQGGTAGEAQLLHNCYSSALALALQNKCKSVAFPLISSGIYGYPKDQALQTAIAAIGEFLLRHELLVYLVVYDQRSYQLSEKLFSAIEKYIDDNYVEKHRKSEVRRSIRQYELPKPMSPEPMSLDSMDSLLMMEQTLLYNDIETVAPEAKAAKGQRSLEDLISRLDKSFAQMLLILIDEKGLTDVETYKRANIDRKLFSKIRSGKGYNPSKATAIAFAIALELNLDETHDLLSRAGYTLSHSHRFDVIIEYFIENGNYNIFEINEALFAFKEDLLGS